MICYTALLRQYLTDALPFPCFLPPLSVYLLSFLLCLLSKDFFFKKFYWRIVDLQCCISSRLQQSESIIHIHIAIKIFQSKKSASYLLD